MRKSFTQKFRHEVAIQRFASPARDAAPRDLEEFWLSRHKYPKAANALWDDAGPCNFSGRTTCLAGDPRTLLPEDPKTPSVLYAGSAAGGLWKSANWGSTWESCWPASLSQSIGAVAIDPRNSSGLVCATGEGNLETASYPGSGIYESNDAGFTWRPFGYVPGKRRQTTEDRDHAPRRVASLCYSANGNLAFGSISNDDELPGGLYMVNKRNELGFVTEWSTRPYNCYSVLYHPKDPDTLFAAIEAGGTVNGIYWTRNGGDSWDRPKGLPPGEECGRISLAISKNRPEVLFALVSSRPTASKTKGNKGQRVRGVYRSKDGGNSWQECPDPKGVFAKQGFLGYNNTIAIHPDNPNIVVCGAQGLFLTEDGGETWRSISVSDPLSPRYLHPDQHAILMPGGKTIYVANDGGVFKSTNLGERSEDDEHGLPVTRQSLRAEATKWRASSHGMNTILFYAVDAAQANKEGRIYGGGTQDNGTLLAGVKEGTGFRKPGDLAFTRVLTGDGGYLVFDRDELELVFGSSFSTETHCHQPGRQWGLSGDTTWQDFSPPVMRTEANVAGLTVMATKPAKAGHPAKLFLGTNRLWWTIYQKRKPKPAWRTSPFGFDGSAISAIEIAAADPEVMYIGTARGGIFRLRGGREYEDWSEDLAGPEIPNHVITQIETHPKDARIVVVTVASTARSAIVLDDGHRESSVVEAEVSDSSGRPVAGAKLRFTRPGGRLPIGTLEEVVTTDKQGLAQMFHFDSLNQPHPHSHVFRSLDSGQTWEDIDRGPERHPQLPNVVMNGLAFETHFPYRLFVAGDAGPWVLGFDGRWASISGNMPSAVISDIIYHHGSKTLFAGSYGRGMWRMKVPKDFDIHPGRKDLDAETAPVEGYLLDPNVPGPEPEMTEILPGRRVRLTCGQVSGAIRYVFEVVLQDLKFSLVNSSPTAAVEMDVPSTGDCTWQCWALLPEEHCSLASQEVRFLLPDRA